MTALLAPPAHDANIASRASYVFQLVEAWLFRSPSARLLGAFGRRLPEVGDEGTVPPLHLNEELPAWLGPILESSATAVDGLTPTQLDTLRRTLVVEGMAANDFHFRKDGNQAYVERWHAQPADFAEDLREAVLTHTRQLGLITPTRPRSDRYDTTLVLGGGNRSPLLRSRYAALLERSGTDLGELSFLGSPRFMTKGNAETGVADEATVVADYAPGATDEFDLLIAGARDAFGFEVSAPGFLCGCGSADVMCPTWPYRDGPPTPPQFTHERESELTSSGRRRGSVLSARTSRPPFRPDTSDTFGLWARLAEPSAGQRALIVTTQIFVPFQTFDGMRRVYLPYGVSVEAVGFGAELGDEWYDRPTTAETLLQETLSAIRSARRLLVEAAEVLML